jgi:hypothetical protein
VSHSLVLCAVVFPAVEVESTGALPPQTLVSESIKLLREKCVKMLAAVEESEAGQ